MYFFFSICIKVGPHSLNRFKTCALKTCQVNYAPDGTYATFPDGVMHSYVMTLGFTEIDPVFAEDYDNSDDLATGLFSGSIHSLQVY